MGLATGFKILKLLNPDVGVQVISAILPVAVAFNSMLFPAVIVLFPPASTIGGTLTFNVILLLVTSMGRAQAALLVIIQLITSPLAGELSVNPVFSIPVLLPLTSHR